MHAALHQYKLRLTNLSQANRSLKLARLAAKRDLDLTETNFVNGLSPVEILTKIAAGKSVTLVPALSASHEPTNLLDRQLNKIFREVRTIHEETGTHDLFIGYPFVEGKFLDGSVARCPVLLFPVRLVRNLSRRPRWRLEVPEGEPIVLNHTFFLAYEKFQQIRLDRSFWEAEVEPAKDLQSLLNDLYGFFREHDLALHFDSDLFRFQLHPFPDRKKDELEALPIGQLRFHSHAVMGIFPQSDSALLKDYEEIEENTAPFNLDRIFSPKSHLSATEKYIPEAQRFFVTPVDQSQEEALLAVKNGQSVVLHGPPGTGKSQVIINLVADALARGQRVLVCSQKRAALDVVHRRLETLGLGRFAALVHDYRSDRARIFAQIRQQIDDIPLFEAESKDLAASKWERDFRLHARQIDEYNAFFEGLCDALTDEQPFGIAPHLLYQMVAPADRPLPVRDLAGQFDDASLDQMLRRMRDLLSYREFFDADHPWRWRLPVHQMNQAQAQQIQTSLTELPARFETLWAAGKATGLDLDLERSALEERWQAYQNFFQQLENPVLEAGWRDFYAQKLEVSYVRRKLNSLENIFREMAGFKFLVGFQMSLFLDLAEHVHQYRTQYQKFGKLFSLGYLKARWYLNAVVKAQGEKITAQNFKAFYAEFRVLERLMKHAASMEGEYFFEQLPLTDRPGAQLSWVRKKKQQLDMIVSERKIRFWEDLKPYPPAGSRELDPVEIQRNRSRLASLRQFLDQRQSLETDWEGWLHPRQVEVLQGHTDGPGAIRELADHWKLTFQGDFQELRQLDALLAELTVPEKAVLERLTDIFGEVRDPGDFLDRLKDNVFRAWIEQLEALRPSLAEVSSRRMPGRRVDFQDKVRERQEKVIRLILKKLKEGIVENQAFNRLGNPVTYREISHQVRKKRLLWSVRRIVREFWEESLDRLLPCWLASPESTAAIFPMVPGFFDLVIFDEASQCYVERALPVMLRGTQCVIAGDDQQLPPFDLYKVKVDENEAEIQEVGVALEVESALDLARNVFTDQYLSWHYRSQEEELINFSNHAFYHGRLKIIPPARPSKEPPIEFISVAGQWEHNSNVAEAERVLELVETLIQSPAAPSIGIVTFNYHQRELIADRMEQRLMDLEQEGPLELAAAYHRALRREAGEEKQGIFIKNIENVQGDERDVIIFSVAYARNSKGRLVTHFGLLSQRGGGNRLNVAVTRARQKIYLLCSFSPTELDVEGATHAGPRLFKEYLQYAQAVSQGQSALVDQLLAELRAGGIAVPEVRFSGEGSPLKHSLAEQLRERGLEVVEDVGDTTYKVDLAVVGPAGNFELGIEVEGRHYFNGRTAKEREVYRLGLLQHRGWRVVRVWSRVAMLGPDALRELVDQLVDLAGEASIKE